MKRFLPGYFYNIATIAGLLLSAVSLGMTLFLMAIESFTGSPKPYMGIVAFVVMPMFLVIGIFIAAFGVVREHRRIRLGKLPGRQIPHMDFGNARHRKILGWILSSTAMLLVFVTFVSFKAYEHTDSDQFCGETCHTVMEPEYTAYQFSPHARVGCVKCHIGPGAGWFVRSKISGTYQVYAVAFNKYPRPIPTPIENLRPAQQTCEQCHWPKQFYSEKMRTNSYYLSDEKNSKFTLNLLMKIGGGNIEAGPTSGIHWHMNIANEITYAFTDTQRQVIPWVQIKRPDGSISVYKSTENPVSDDSLKVAGKFRKMDCIDCHNRPTHIYHPPSTSINHLMELGWVDPSLPYAKSISVKALEFAYSSKQVGIDSIRTAFESFYKENYPEIASTKNDAIERAAMEVQKIYERNYFPQMGSSWKKYPDNLGHLYYPGCFRCHDGKHVNEAGKVLSRDCNTCHTILSQEFQNDTLRLSLGGIEYKHPVDIGDAWKEVNCSSCHFDQ